LINIDWLSISITDIQWFTDYQSLIDDVWHTYHVWISDVTHTSIIIWWCDGSEGPSTSCVSHITCVSTQVLRTREVDFRFNHKYPAVKSGCEGDFTFNTIMLMVATQILNDNSWNKVQGLHLFLKKKVWLHLFGSWRGVSHLQPSTSTQRHRL